MIPAREGAPICFLIPGIEREVFDADCLHDLEKEHR
jgi:hypothetical protein